jgi:hypothetical protein
MFVNTQSSSTLINNSMEKVLHKHHIIPKHAGGTDNSSNLVYLTVEEHAEAHRLLYEQHNRQEDYLAWKGLAGLIGKDEMIKEKCSLNSSRPGELNTFYGKQHTAETKQKISEAQKRRKVERPESFKTYKRTDNHRKDVGSITKSRATRYTFKHPDHGEFYGTTGDLAKTYNFSRTSEAYKLVKGEYKSYKGWILDK